MDSFLTLSKFTLRATVIKALAGNAYEVKPKNRRYQNEKGDLSTKVPILFLKV